MKKLSRLSLLMVLAMPAHVIAADIVKLNWNTAVREYCHVVHFVSGWKRPLPDRNSYLPNFEFGGSDYEFRVPGLLGTKFLVRGVIPMTVRHYTRNIYEVDLADPSGLARPATEEEWKSATVIPIRYTGSAEELGKYLDPLPLQYVQRKNEHDEVVLVSPDRAIVMGQSWTGTLGRDAGSDVPGDFSIHLSFSHAHGTLFWDAYSADTGKKLLTISAKFATIFPEEIFVNTGWVTERFFFVPLDERRERCLICDFGRR